MQELTIAEDRDGARLDAAVHAMCGLSRHAARRLCEIGGVAHNGVRGQAAARLQAGDRIAWQPATTELSLELGLPVLFADDDLLVVHKPPGLAAHKGPLVEDSIAERLLALPGAGLAHRLDRGASGLLLIGRHPQALAQLALAMERSAIERHYLAIAHGVLDGDQRTIDLPLLATDEPRGNQPKVIVDAERGQRAVTHLAVIERGKHATLLRVRLETGRTHQIRAHLRAIGHPLLGDPRYGDPAANARARETHGIDRPMLHSERLVLPSPRSGASIEVSAWLEPDFARLFPVRRP